METTLTVNLTPEELQSMIERVMKKYLTFIPEKEFYTTAEICDKLSLSPSKMTAIRDRRKIEYYQDGRNIRYKSTDLYKFFDKIEPN
jgi:hypothetical protein